MDNTNSDPTSASRGGLSKNLPLEIFDNFDFEMYTPEEWMVRGTCTTEEETDEIEIPARTMFPATGTTTWHACVVIRYNEKAETFDVCFPSGDVERRTRIQLCFDAEDPQKFVNRLVFCHAAREMAEALIRYNLYVDCMPTDGVAQLDSEQINRIVSRALNTIALKRNEFDTNQLLSEVNTDFARTMVRFFVFVFVCFYIFYFPLM